MGILKSFLDKQQEKRKKQEKQIQIEAVLKKFESKLEGRRSLSHEEKERFERLPTCCQKEALPPMLYIGEQRERCTIKDELLKNIQDYGTKRQKMRMQALLDRTWMNPIRLDLSQSRLIGAVGGEHGSRSMLVLQRLLLQLILNYGASGMRVIALDTALERPLAWLKDTFVCQNLDHDSLYFESLRRESTIKAVLDAVDYESAIVVFSGAERNLLAFLEHYPRLLTRKNLAILVPLTDDSLRERWRTYRLIEVNEGRFSYEYEEEDLYWAAAMLTMSPALNREWMT